jgi:hypothetical protein
MTLQESYVGSPNKTPWASTAKLATRIVNRYKGVVFYELQRHRNYGHNATYRERFTIGPSATAICPLRPSGACRTTVGRVLSKKGCKLGCFTQVPLCLARTTKGARVS